MDFVDFSKQLYRMCESTEMCENCGLRGDGCLVDIPVHRLGGSFSDKQLAKIGEIVEKWAAEHPAETRQSEFLKMFPDAPVCFGVVKICPTVIDKHFICGRSKGMSCTDCEKSFWFTEVRK